MTQMINKLTVKAISVSIIASFLAVTALPVASAEAGHKKHWKHHHHQQVKRRHNNGGELLAAGIIGLAIGAIIADQSNRNRAQPDYVYVEPSPRYVKPAPVYDPYYDRRPLNDVYDNRYNNNYDNGPKVIRYEDEFSTSYEPWTPGWANWCRNRYRSFNANTGTFRGYDSKDHFCVVK